MGKYDYAPQTARLGPPLILAGGMVLSAGMSSHVHMRHDNIYSMLASTAAVVLLSNLAYCTLTTVQCVVHVARSACARRTDKGHRADLAAARGPIEEGTRAGAATVMANFTATKMLTQTIDFQHESAEIKLFVSREEVWRMLYPLAGAFYVLFVCLPVYDATCTVCLSFGFFAQSTHSEIRRGIYFRRPTGRRIIFCLMSVWGLVSHCLAFVFVYIAGARATSEGWQAGRGLVDELEDLHSLLFNVSASYMRSLDAVATLGGNNTIATMLHGDSAGTNISAPPGFRYQFEDANVAQYLTWSAHAYPQTMCVLWVLCLFTPNMLRNVPASVRLPVALETTQPAVSAVAMVVLCAASWALDVPVFALVDSQNALGDVFLLTGGAGIWFCIFMLVRGVRDRCGSHIAVVVLVVAMGKTVVQHAPLLRNHQAYELMICTWVAIGLYAAICVLFCRKENVAVRGGWGNAGGDDNGSVMDTDDEIELSLSRAQAGPEGVYTIDDVMTIARDNISSSDQVMASSTRLPATKRDTDDEPGNIPSAKAEHEEEEVDDTGSEHGSARTVLRHNQ